MLNFHDEDTWAKLQKIAKLVKIVIISLCMTLNQI